MGPNILKRMLIVDEEKGGAREGELGAAQEKALIAAARGAALHSYSPYSGFAVGAALLMQDGRVITGTNVENASYGMTLCAETVAAAKAMAAGARGGLLAVAVTGPDVGPDSGSDEGPVAGVADAPTAASEPITPCGRCRQVLSELAQLGGTDPIVLCVGGDGAGADDVRRIRLSALLPHAFGPAHLA